MYSAVDVLRRTGPDTVRTVVRVMQHGEANGHSSVVERISNHGQGHPTLSFTKSAETEGSWEDPETSVVQLGFLDKHDTDRRPVLD
jgi:hypothetical protein